MAHGQPKVAVRATARQARMRAAFIGFSKSGKTFDSLVTATRLVQVLKENGRTRGNGRIVVIDSEHGRSNDYGDIFDYDVMELFSKAPEAYTDFIHTASKEGYEVIIIDQISDEWAGSGGILEITSAISESSASKNSYFAYGKTTPRHNKFIEAITGCVSHIICTMRVKTDYVLDTNERGGIQPRKVGLKPVARESTDYEFDIVATIDDKHNVSVETRGMLSELIGNRVLTPGSSIRDPGQVVEIGDLFGKWVCGRATPEDLGVISRDQADEIQSYGERLGWSYAIWKKFLSQYNVSSISMLNPEHYEQEKPLLLDAIARKEKADRGSEQAKLSEDKNV